MMKAFVRWMAVLIALGGTAFAQTAAIQNHCTQGGVQANVSGLPSTNYLNGIIPSCAVTVYLTGTQTKATIYADGSNTPLTNPFTANTATSTDPGGFKFWAAINQGYDVVLSGGIAPNVYKQPVTIVGVYPGFSFSGGGGNINPAPQYRLFIQPNAGTQSVAGPAVTGVNAVAPMMQGAINSDLYATGGGNNGINNAVTSADCGAGCLFSRPQTSTDTENIPNILNGKGDYFHGVDNLYGGMSHYYYNAGINSAGSNGSRDVQANTCFWNDVLANSTAKMTCNSKYSMLFSSGLYISGSPIGFKSTNEIMYDYARSINQLHSGTLFANHVGDVALDYDYLYYLGGATTPNDEGVKGDAKNMIELAAPYGTVTTGGQGATIVRSNFNNAGLEGDGMQLVDLSSLSASGLILSQTTNSGTTLNVATTSDTHAVSTGIGTLNGACGTNQARNNPLSATCNINILSGSFTTGMVCVGDSVHKEQAAVSAVGTGTITMGLTYAHQTGTRIYQGGLCGNVVALGHGNTTPFDANHDITGYWIAGSSTATSFDYIVVFKGDQNGHQPIPLTTVPISVLGPLTRAGNVVTTTNPYPGSYFFNNYVAPAAASIVVSGATPSDLNGVVTGTVVNANTMSWNQTGANETGSGGTLTVTGLNNYFAYCTAETVQVLDSNLNGPSGISLDGKLQVEPNACPWAIGDSVAQAKADTVQVIAHIISDNALTVPVANPNTHTQITMSGPGNSGAVEYNVQSSDAIGNFIGYGGLWQPHIYAQSNGFYKNMFQFTYPPLNGGDFASIGCPPEGCGVNNYPYRLFELQGWNGTSTQANYMLFYPGNSTFGVSTGFTANNYVAGAKAMGVDGGGQLPGTNGYGGYFTPVGIAGQTISNNVVDFGNGTPADASGTIGVNNLYAPQVIAGVQTPTNPAPVVVGTAGTTTYTYACTAVTANGETPAGTGTITNGPATLSTANFIAPKCIAVPGAQSLNVYRLVGGATQGKIANIPNGNDATSAALHDTGLVGDGTTPPGTNTTGSFTGYGPTSAFTIGGSPICTVASGCGGSMVYPGAGVAVSTGTAWGTSIAQANIPLLNAVNTFTGGTNTFTGSAGGVEITTSSGAADIYGYPSSGSGFHLNGITGTGFFNALNISSLVGSTGCVGHDSSGDLTGVACTGGGFITSLTTTGSGAATVSSGVLNIPNYTYTLPQATTSVLGGVMCDGTTITCTAGVIAAVGSGSTGISGQTLGYLPLAGSATTLTSASHLDDGITTAATITSTEPIVAPSFSTAGTTPGKFSLVAGTGSIPALAANSAGFAGPVTGGTSWLGKLPATITAGILHFGAPGTVDGVNESAITSGPVSLTADVSGILPVANGGTGTSSPGIVAGTNVTVTGTWPNQTVNASGGIANTTTTVGTTAVAANTCTTATTVTMTGLATTSVINFTPNSDISGVTGWGSTGGLAIVAWPTANTLNYKVCNQTASSITPSASVTFNVGAR